MDDLGTNDKIIEDMNLIKYGNLRVKVHFLEGDLRECLGGDEWWILDTVGSMRTEERKFYYLISFQKTS